MKAHEVESQTLTHGYKVVVEYDPEPSSPTEWDNVGEIAYSSDRYCIGTENVSREQLREIGAGIENGSLIGLPVYTYIHSGVTIRAGSGFSCRWDSGQSGWVYCTKEKAIKEFGKKICTAKVKEHALRCLKAEVETFDQYLTGQVYGYRVLDAEGDGAASCWGFYGDSEDCLKEGVSAAQYLIAAAEEEAAEVLYWAARDIATV